MWGSLVASPSFLCSTGLRVMPRQCSHSWIWYTGSWILTRIINYTLQALCALGVTVAITADVGKPPAVPLQKAHISSSAHSLWTRSSRILEAPEASDCPTLGCHTGLLNRLTLRQRASERLCWCSVRGAVYSQGQGHYRGALTVHWCASLDCQQTWLWRQMAILMKQPEVSDG